MTAMQIQTPQQSPPTNGHNKTQPAPQQAPKSRLGAVVKGTLQSARRFLVYGPEGVGKSTLAAGAPSPIFFDIEGGSGDISVARYPFRDGIDGHVARSYAEVLAAIDDLAANGGEYKTLVIDTVDALEALIHKHVIAQAVGKNYKSIEDFGYGKGYNVALDTYRELLARLDRVRAAGLSVILLGHCTIKSFKNPTGDDYDRYQLRVHDKAGGLIKEWCDVVGFIRYDELAAKLDGGARAKGVSTGRRLMSTVRTAAWDAKSRLQLDHEIEIGTANPWAPFAYAMSELANMTPESIRKAIMAECERLGETFTGSNGRVRTTAEVSEGIKNLDRDGLLRTLGALKELQPQQKENGESEQ